MAEKLTAAAREQALSGLNGWILEEAADAISHDFKFKDFSEAFAFMARVALLAERQGHHPDWSNSYNTVAVRLSTHSAKGVTELDLKLAKKMNEF